MTRYRLATLTLTLLMAASMLWTFQDPTGFLLPAVVVTCALVCRRRAAMAVAAAATMTYVAFAIWHQGSVNVSVPGLLVDIVLSVIIFLAAEIVGMLTRDVEDAARHLVPVEIGRQMPDAAMCQQRIEEEVRRARRFNRPLTAVGFCLQDDVAAPCPELVHQLIRRHARYYVQGIMAEEIAHRTKETDIITVRQGNMIVLLPETEREQADLMVDRVCRQIEQTTGSRVSGISVSFPEEQSTLSGLFQEIVERLADSGSPAGRSPGELPEAVSDVKN